jgi:glyoxylase-like metal-dependent hydrolase (beta-lactamase superfamily II)
VEPILLEVAPGITAIDTVYGGRERYTAAYLIAAREPCLVETGPTTSLGHVVDGLTRLGITPADLAHVVVTHIHLDHAGGVGAVARTYPRATVWVHEAGARHLVDPDRLVASATRIYGEEAMARLFGPVEPVPQERLRSLADGDVIALGDRRLLALATPGHAKHQVALLDDATGAVFTGDALGIHPPDLPVLRPATPPPDYDLDLALGSIERIRGAARTGGLVLFAHYGPVAEVDRICDLAASRFRAWTETVAEALERSQDLEAIVELLRGEALRDVETGAGAAIDLARLETLSSIRMNALGIVRYLEVRRRGGTEPPSAASRSATS